MKRLVLILTAVAVVLGAGYGAYAKKKAGYVGSEQCATCHKSSHAALITGYNRTAHHVAMVDVAKKPDAIVAVFDDKSPVKKADIKYVLGLGKVYQNYLDKDLKVLPGKWDTKSKSWVAQESVDGAAQCVGCHVTNFDPEGKAWTELGVGCESCHGPGEAHVDSMDAADIKNLKKLDAKKKDMVCGQCHSVGTDPSGKYAFPTTFVPGDDLDKSFKLKDSAGSPTNFQYNEFITSTHYKGGMSCTTCHDTHGNKAKAEHQLKQPITDQCLACHSSTIESIKKHAPDAPADATCATCHMVKGAHKFEKAGK